MEVSNPFICPLHRQRYHEALTRIKKIAPEFVIDLGCSTCDFIFYILQNPGSLKFLVGVDKDVVSLRSGNRLLTRNPNTIFGNTHDFYVFLQNEDISQLSDEFIKQYQFCPFVSMLEVIEHMDAVHVDNAVHQIFDLLTPTFLFLTTPNFEYNENLEETFGKRKSKFRHFDHMFEWTRKEFFSWCSWICDTYGYAVEIGGIGKLLDGNDHDNLNGYASHSAFFARLPQIQKVFKHPINSQFAIVLQIKNDNDNEERMLSFCDETTRS